MAQPCQSYPVRLTNTEQCQVVANLQIKPGVAVFWIPSLKLGMNGEKIDG